MHIRDVLGKTALVAIDLLHSIEPGFVKLTAADSDADNVSCFSNCLSCRAQCISSAIVPITARPDEVPYAPIAA